MAAKEDKSTTKYAGIYRELAELIGDLIKFIYKMGCFFTENSILLQSDEITCAIFFTLLIKIRCY